MKLSVNDIVDKKRYLSHAVLNCITDEIISAKGKDEEYDVRMTIDGHEVDINEFFKVLQDQHEKMIGEEARKLACDIEVENFGHEVQQMIEEFKHELGAKIQDKFPGVEFNFNNECYW